MTDETMRDLIRSTIKLNRIINNRKVYDADIFNDLRFIRDVIINARTEIERDEALKGE